LLSYFFHKHLIKKISQQNFLHFNSACANLNIKNLKNFLKKKFLKKFKKKFQKNLKKKVFKKKKFLKKIVIFLLGVYTTHTTTLSNFCYGYPLVKITIPL